MEFTLRSDLFRRKLACMDFRSPGLGSHFFSGKYAGCMSGLQGPMNGLWNEDFHKLSCT